MVSAAYAAESIASYKATLCLFLAFSACLSRSVLSRSGPSSSGFSEASLASKNFCSRIASLSSFSLSRATVPSPVFELGFVVWPYETLFKVTPAVILPNDVNLFGCSNATLLLDFVYHLQCINVLIQLGQRLLVHPFRIFVQPVVVYASGRCM